jgi:hypothetical protein
MPKFPASSVVRPLKWRSLLHAESAPVGQNGRSFCFFLGWGAVAFESRARIVVPLVPIATGHAWAWMLQSGLVGAQAFLSAVVVLERVRRSRHCIHS